MNKEDGEIAEMYSKENNYGRDLEHGPVRSADLSQVLVPISIHVPGKLLAILREFAERENLSKKQLIQKWIYERVKQEHDILRKKINNGE
ncbi:MAG: hypothetical protein ACXABY_14640 [Candidatus Thorarchaeota archaeon]|jgi:hypothetical protein